MVIADNIVFSHYFGNTHINAWIDLENVGGRTITIRRITAVLARGERTTQILTARTYWVTESFSRENPLQLPLSEIRLKPGEKWSGLLHLWDVGSWTKAVESNVKSVISKIRDNINSKIKSQNKEMQTIPLHERSLVEADQNLVQEALDIVKNLKRIEQGEYELLTAVYENVDQKPLKILGFDLTIFENDVRDVFEDTQEYKYGFGIHITGKPKYVDVRIRAKYEFDTKKRFDSLFRSLTN